MSTGKLIVIDGTDGSGKTEQVTRLVARFQTEGRKAVMIDFPRYGRKSAEYVEKYLRGELGTADEVGPYRASVYFAWDRFNAAPEMRQLLDEGTIIVCNRYVSANMGHQAGKIADPKEREKFLTWLKEFEYDVYGIPRPDVNILLYVPPEKGQEFVTYKRAREYTKGKSHDIHEADIEHLRHASEAYREVAKKEGWKVINCHLADPKDPDDLALALNKTHEEVWAYLKEKGAA